MDISLERELFAALTLSKIRRRELCRPQDANMFTIAAETTASSDIKGRVVYAEYKSGAVVRRNKTSVLVRTSDGTYWLGDTSGRWYRLD